MIARIICLLALLACATVAQAAKPVGAPQARPVQNLVSIPTAATFFPLSQVRLLDGPFKRRQDINTRYLLDMVEPDRLIAPFRAQAGLPAKAKAYGAWERLGHGASGHTAGHYLTALSFLQAAAGDPKVRDEARRRIDYMVSELIACRRAKGNGDIMPGSKTAPTVAGLSMPFYKTHKLLAGLRDACQLAGNKNALALERSIVDWLDTLLRPLTPQQIQNMLAREYGGMNEVLADLAADTGNARYAHMAASCFHRDTVLNPLYRGEDRLGKLHANTQIPIIVGLAREYELTGDTRYRTAATSFWHHVVNNRSYVIGGNSESEHFFPPERFPQELTARTCETCNTNNMLKLTHHLFEWKPDAAQMDYVERALINHIAASMGGQPGEFSYFLSLSAVGVKTFSKPLDAFWCCVGTGMENPAKYGEQIYAHDTAPDAAPALWINQYIASSLDWPEAGLRITQETQFPDSDTIRIKITTADSKPRPCTIKLRHPAWCAALQIKVNNQPVKDVSPPSTYIGMTRNWKDGDTIELRLPMTLRAEPLPHSDGKIVALMFGPNVLAAIIPDAPGFESPARHRFASQLDARGKTDSPPPLLVAPNTTDALARLRPIDGRFAEFRAENLFTPDAFDNDATSTYANLTLVPLHRTYEEQFAVYFPFLTPAEWTKRETQIRADYQARQKLEAATLDTVAPGDSRSEARHAVRNQNSKADEAFDRKCRMAREDGWFSYEMTVAPDTPVTLIATYWGGLWDERNFDITIDGQPLATQRLYNNSPGNFIDIPYSIPPGQTRGKTKITVRFSARPKTAELFTLRTVRTDALPPAF